MKIPGSEIECLKYIDKCIESLNISLSTTSSSKAIESIRLQKNHHTRQRELLQFHVDKFRRNEKHNSSVDVPVPSEEKIIFNAYKGQNDLFENLKLTDEVLNELKNSESSGPATAKLLELNSQLQQIVSKLVHQIDETVIENDLLKDKIKDFGEGGKIKDMKLQSTVDDNSGTAGNQDDEFAPLDLPKFDVS